VGLDDLSKKRIRVFWLGALVVIILLFSLFITGCLSEPQPAAPPLPASTQEGRWRQDLHYLATELPRLHKNLFFQITEEEFQHAVAQLYEAIPSMRDDEIIIGIARVVAMVGDGHTRLNLLQEAAGFRVYPLSLYWFKDGLYVVKTTSEYSRVLRSRVVQIGDTDIEEASVAVSALISHENEAQLRNRSPDYLVTPEILHALSILPDMQSGRFVFEDAQGNRFALNMAPVARNEKSEWLSAVDPAMDPTPPSTGRSQMCTTGSSTWRIGRPSTSNTTFPGAWKSVLSMSSLKTCSLLLIRIRWSGLSSIFATMRAVALRLHSHSLQHSNGGTR